MYRRNYRRYYSRGYNRPVQPVKYSNETYNVTFQYLWGSVPNSVAVTMIPASEVQGMRKTKNFTLNISQSPTTNAEGVVQATSSFIYALVYVPAGTVANAITIGNGSAAASLYEPNQNVICTGVCDSSSGQLRISSRLARNLNSGDSVALVLRPTNTSGTEGNITRASVTLNFAIAY